MPPPEPLSLEPPFQLHRHVEQLLQNPSKGFCSFLDQLLQNLSWYSLFQVWVHLILLSRFAFLFLENPVPDLCLSDPRPDQKLQKTSYTTPRPARNLKMRNCQ